MNFLDKFSDWEINPAILTNKKQQTDKKIEYVRDYVARWAVISAARREINTITFIDCMCNAGVYRDGDCGTAIEVLQVFCDVAKNHPEKHFRVMCNDNREDIIDVLKTVSAAVKAGVKNVRVYTSCSDVNDCLDWIQNNPSVDGKKIFGYGYSTILYVDPYDFGTVHVPKISAILKKYYCELIFNFFVSDYVRNINNDKGRIQKCLGGQAINDKDELITYIRTVLRVGHIKHLFSYEFRISNNVELYQIVFATPSKRGLEVLKESLWNVFNGAEYHRNKIDNGQISLFTAEDDKKYNLETCSNEARLMLKMYFGGKEKTFDEIEEFLIEYTMLRESQIIEHVLKPMINAGQIKKCGYASGRNYKKDSYIITKEQIHDSKKPNIQN